MESKAGEHTTLPSNQTSPDSSSRAPSASIFDIDPSASDLVALGESKKDGTTTGARRRGASQEGKVRLRKTKYAAGLLAIGFTVFAIRDLGREWETIAEYEKYADDPANDTFLTRARLRLANMYVAVFKAPQWEKLLPDPLPFPYSRPYTLVIDLDDLLIHSKWSRETAWRISKRPGLNYFLGYLTPWYEIVVYTTQPFYVVAPILEQLDPDRRYFTYQLFRESCRTLDNGQIAKDLDALNRDLSKVVVLETNPDVVQLHPENAIILPKWTGNPKDTDLIGLVDFLEAIGIYNIADVRQTIKAYEGTHIPTEHPKRQAEIKKKQVEEWKAKHQSKGSWFGGFGSAVAKSDVPKSFYELEKERFQRAYVEDEQYWKENGPLMRKQAEEEQQKQIKEMKMSPWAFITGQGGAIKPQETQPAEQQQQQQQ